MEERKEGMRWDCIPEVTVRREREWVWVDSAADLEYRRGGKSRYMKVRGSQ